MSKPAQSRLVAVAIIIGLFSAVACQVHISHFVPEAAAVPGRHAAEEATGSHHTTHHGSHEGEDEPIDPCCTPQVADTKSLKPMDAIPQAVEVAEVGPWIVEPAVQSRNVAQGLNYKPPGSRSLLLRTGILLI